VKKKTVTTRPKQGGSIVTRSTGTKSNVVGTPTTSNKSSKKAHTKEAPRETSIDVVMEEKEKKRDSYETGKKKVVSYMRKISNEILKSAKDAHKATILKANDSLDPFGGVILAFLEDKAATICSFISEIFVSRAAFLAEEVLLSSSVFLFC